MENIGPSSSYCIENLDIIICNNKKECNAADVLYDTVQ